MPRTNGTSVTAPDPQTVGRIRATYTIYLTGLGIDPSEITARTGLLPSRVAREGLREGRPRPPMATLWSIRADRDEDNAEGVLRDLIGMLRPAWQTLVELGATCGTGVTIGADPIDVMPSFVLPRDLLLAVSEIAAYLDIDIHVDIEQHQVN